MKKLMTVLTLGTAAAALFAASDEDDMVCDETFEAIQENYQSLIEAYNAVVELYESDDIEADEDIEDTLASASDVIDQMGEITQEETTEDEAEVLNEAMLDILEALSLLIDQMSEA